MRTLHLPTRSILVLAASALLTGCHTTALPRTSLEQELPAETKAVREAQAHFTYHGKPIHPLLVRRMLGLLGDERPTMIMADVAAAAGNQNEFADEAVKASGKLVTCEKGSGYEYERFDYEKLGTLTNGVVVLRTYESSSGSGVFEELALFRFESGPGLVDQPYPQLLMRLVGSHPLGDRYDGKVQVLHDRVVVGAWQDRPAKVIRFN